jgi:hypothetical protein
LLAYDEATSLTEPKPVTDLIRPAPKPTFLLTLTDGQGETETFEATGDHPWLIAVAGAGKRWAETRELAAGALLLAADGETLLLVSVAATGCTGRTYNLTVDDHHTFLVGEDGVIVHNAVCPLQMAVAAARYPGKAGKFEYHHIWPKYLGGARNGPTARIDAAYHQMITNKFREYAAYGEGYKGVDVKKLMEKVYVDFPLP